MSNKEGLKFCRADSYGWLVFGCSCGRGLIMDEIILTKCYRCGLRWSKKKLIDAINKATAQKGTFDGKDKE